MIGLNIEMPIPERCVDCALYNVRTMCCHVLNQWCVGIDKLPNCPLVEDVATIRHAYWNTKRTSFHDGETYCSECEYETERRTTYCPNCGAKMEEEK